VQRSWVEVAALRHLTRLARLQAIRFALAGAALVYAAGAAFNREWRHAPAEALLWALRQVDRVPGIDLAENDFFKWLASTDLTRALGTLISLVAVFALLLAIERGISRARFPDVS
jgi:hypothetical protein